MRDKLYIKSINFDHRISNQQRLAIKFQLHPDYLKIADFCDFSSVQLVRLAHADDFRLTHLAPSQIDSSILTLYQYIQERVHQQKETQNIRAIEQNQMDILLRPRFERKERYLLF